MERDIKRLKIPGYHFDDSTVSNCNSVYYNKDEEPEDNWIEIIQDSNTSLLIFLLVEKCSTVKAFTLPNTENIENNILKSIKE